MPKGPDSKTTQEPKKQEEKPQKANDLRVRVCPFGFRNTRSCGSIGLFGACCSSAPNAPRFCPNRAS